MAVYRADQIGSLIRPSRLLDARDDYKAGKIGREAVRAVEDDCVLEVLKLQQDAGMPIFTDGEMRRDAWQTNFSEAVDENRGEGEGVVIHGGEAIAQGPACHGAMWIASKPLTCDF